MSTVEANELSDVLDRVKDWPPARRIALARRILETVETHEAMNPTRGVPVESVVGLLRGDREPPTDEECSQIVEEERWKKYGR